MQSDSIVAVNTKLVQLYMFAFLGRISTNHSGSGLINSWRWNSSNFHVDDVMDSSYTDAEHVPLYSLNFPPDQVEVCILCI